MNYLEKLKDPRWQKKRLEVLQRDEFRCQLCWDDKKTLHIHHKYYKKGNPWDYPMKALITLCCVCHEKISVKKKIIDFDENINDCKKLTQEEMEKVKVSRDAFFKKYKNFW